MSRAPNVSEFSLHTEQLVQVLFEPSHRRGPRVDGVSVLCSRTLFSSRFPEILNAPVFVENCDFTKNESIIDDEIDLYSDKRKLNTTFVGIESIDESKLHHSESQTIYSVLKNIGLVCNNDKMYTLQPSKMYYYKYNITSYNPNRISFLPRQDNSAGFFDKYNSKTRHHSIPFQLSQERNVHNNIGLKKKYQKQNNITKNIGFIYPDKACWNYSRKNVDQMPPLKYWSMRHMLFSNFESGILLDKESFYSVCPEILSYHIAKRCKNDIALDPFCGAGGNIIQLALTCKLVIAIDVDPIKINLARHNAEIYGIADKIEFIVGDFFAISSMLKADVIFMSPPWGGPKYSNDNFSIESMCNNQYGGGFGIFNIVKNITDNVAFHMPKTTNIYECLWLAKDFGKVEIQQNIINEKLNSITAFYGEFIDLTDDDY